jgi:hypothetical protein
MVGESGAELSAIAGVQELLGNAMKLVFKVHRITSQSRRVIKVIAGLPTADVGVHIAVTEGVTSV